MGKYQGHTINAFWEAIYEAWYWFGNKFVDPKFRSARCPFCKGK